MRKQGTRLKFLRRFCWNKNSGIICEESKMIAEYFLKTGSKKADLNKKRFRQSVKQWAERHIVSF